MGDEVERDWEEGGGPQMGWSRKGCPEEYRAQGCPSDKTKRNTPTITKKGYLANSVFSGVKTGPLG